jgi:hypothetical protein
MYVHARALYDLDACKLHVLHTCKHLDHVLTLTLMTPCHICPREAFEVNILVGRIVISMWS